MDFDFAVITDHWRFLASGVGITLLLSVVSGLTSLVAGLVVALLRLYGPRPLRVAVVLYIDSMRAIPVLVVLVWSFFALPILTGLTMPPFVAEHCEIDQLILMYGDDQMDLSRTRIPQSGLLRAAASGPRLRVRRHARRLPADAR